MSDGLQQLNYNPDVLSCLANLSNDEVFTPPNIANDILDLLPESIWHDKNATFLDPCVKTGVFLREIVKRLLKGLETEIPDLQERINHICTKQVFGIAITELTSFLSRRSVYCSKTADGKYSICTEFDGSDGNITYSNIQHTWDNGKCLYCGASQELYERDNELESHAYQFIHTNSPEEIFNMKFDVIIGNPPYQLSDGGNNASAKPIYHLFVEQAKKLNPRYLTMIIPARWFSGGKGLDTFRNEMLHDNRIRVICDFFNSETCFPGIDLSGGVCYFLWSRDNKGKCKITSIRWDKKSTLERNLLEDGCDTFIRFNEALPILNKIWKFNEKKFDTQVSSRKPFGMPTSVSVHQNEESDDIKIFAYPKNGFVNKSEITKNMEWVDKYKVMVAKAFGDRGEFPYNVLPKPFIGNPGTCCSETYIIAGLYDNEIEAQNTVKYLQTRFVRFLVLLVKNTQDATQKVYSFVPAQDFREEWTDKKLYEKYGLTKDEIDFIESLVKPSGE